MVETELHGRSAQGKYEGKFRGQAHFCGYLLGEINLPIWCLLAYSTSPFWPLITHQIWGPMWHAIQLRLQLLLLPWICCGGTSEARPNRAHCFRKLWFSLQSFGFKKSPIFYNISTNFVMLFQWFMCTYLAISGWKPHGPSKWVDCWRYRSHIPDGYWAQKRSTNFCPTCDLQLTSHLPSLSFFCPIPGKNKPVIKKALVELEGAPFKLFSSLREEWSLGDYFVSPG